MSESPVIWSELFWLLVADSQGALRRVTNIDAVMSSVQNIISTRPGERVMLPDFAQSVRGILFENITDRIAQRHAADVKRVIEQWDPRVQVSAVDYAADPDGNFVDCAVSFSVRGYENTFKTSARLSNV